MVETVGKKLQQARLRKKISVEEAAHATKVRPGRIADLENDDYTNFPNMTYGKGFLIIYARYLGVDVSDFADSLENTNPVGVADYEYLSHNPGSNDRVVRRRIKKGSWKPFIYAMLGLVGAAIIINFAITFQRLGPLERLEEKRLATDLEPSPAPVPNPTPALRATTPVASPPVEPTLPVAALTPTPTPIEQIEVRRAEPVIRSESAAPPVSTPAFTPAAIKEVTIRPVKKTWVKITKDVQGSPPVFEDWFYPDARPLSFKGTKFWIEIGDKDAVKITKDGTPLSYVPPGVTVE